MSRLNLADIQGMVLRRYLMPVQRHFLFKVTNPAAARSVLGRMVSRNEADAPHHVVDALRIGFADSLLHVFGNGE